MFYCGDMKPLKIRDAETMILALQDEIRRSDESRYDHRLHGVLLVAQGLSCRETAGVLGDAPRTVENWVHRFERDGLAGLTDTERSGRPSRLVPYFLNPAFFAQDFQADCGWSAGRMTCSVTRRAATNDRRPSSLR